MIQGKLRAAVRWLTERDSAGLLSPSEMTKVKTSSGEEIDVSVLDVLRLKHPDPGASSKEACTPYPEVPAIAALDINGAHIQLVVRRLHGAAGPSGSDAGAWQDWLLRYGAHSERLRDAVAHLTRVVANTTPPWEFIRGLMASRLIAIDKCPGVRPIGVGESLRRIMGKSVMLLAGEDVQEVCGSDQLSAGLEAGIEAAVHAVNSLFEEHQGSGWGVLLVDAANAFNALNRKVALWHARHLWPRGCRYLFNTYKGWAALVMSGYDSNVLYSKEGTTQGDPLSMAFYAVGVLPLILKLRDFERWVQVWYADDANNCAKLSLLREWFDMLLAAGPAFGYFPQPSKSVLVVADCDVPEAKRLFDDLSIMICTSHRLLGGHVGSSSGKMDYVQSKVDFWTQCVSRLADVASKQPQDAYAALTKSVMFEWSFLQRIVPECGELFEPVEEMISDRFLPQLLGCELSTDERTLFALPIKFAGLGIANPTATANSAFETSKTATKLLSTAIQGLARMDTREHHQSVTRTRSAHQASRKRENIAAFNTALQTFPKS